MGEACPYEMHMVWQACAVTYFTGSGAFNRKMRQHAVEAGYTLNEHALVRDCQNLDTRPYDIFNCVGTYYVMMADCAGSWQCPVDPQTKAKGAPLPIPDERCACLRLIAGL